MKLEPEDVAAATRRLKRARGQLDAVIRMLEEGVDCEEIVPQITAAATAVRRAGYLVIAEGMTKCLTQAERDEQQEQQLQKMLLSLALGWAARCVLQSLMSLFGHFPASNSAKRKRAGTNSAKKHEWWRVNGGREM